MYIWMKCGGANLPLAPTYHDFLSHMTNQEIMQYFKDLLSGIYFMNIQWIQLFPIPNFWK